MLKIGLVGDAPNSGGADLNQDEPLLKSEDRGAKVSAGLLSQRSFAAAC